jgi:hypothetical protein
MKRWQTEAIKKSLEGVAQRNRDRAFKRRLSLEKHKERVRLGTDRPHPKYPPAVRDLAPGLARKTQTRELSHSTKSVKSA